ncbi:beta strand repeat-containing protein [Prosthecobacter sp.]|uniref:beta strand repeat-containing protein n=1 Tax=Prosthecobacter sp. TaxID=1965333 RepID=UPI0037830A65
MKIHLRSLVAGLSLVLTAASLQAATFVISSNSTTAQTLSANGETGTVNAGKSLVLGSSTNSVTMSATTALTNNGTIQQTGTGRAVDNNTAGAAMTIINTGTINTASSDAIRVNKDSAISLTNSGTISVTAGNGGQALDWAAITTKSNSVTNQATGIISDVGEDAIKPGVSSVINNAGSITATPVVTSGAASGSDGIDTGTNTGANVTNTGTISGRHGITGGLSTSGTYAITVTNNAGGMISAANGSGINIDGVFTGVTASVTNAQGATIQGGVLSTTTDGDGDGVDVDGILTLQNSGDIFGLGAKGTGGNPEAVSIGGGSITNYATGRIIGSSLAADAPNGDPAAEGHGILVDDSNGGNAIAAATITNSGLIQGKSGFGIKMIGTFANTVTNNAGGTIRGAGTGAAIQTGNGNDTLNNAGTITGDNGSAIDLQGGNDALNITGGTITGNIDGGTGTNTATISPGAGNTFSYAGSFSNFSSVDISTGNVILSGSSTYSGNTTVSGTLSVTNTTGSATGSGSVMVNSGGTLNGTGTVGSVSLASGGVLAPGVTVGTLNVNGTLDITSGSHFAFDLGSTSDLLNISGALRYTGGGSAIFDISDTGSMTYGGDYTLMNFGSSSGLTLSNLSFGSTPAGFSGEFTIGANSLTLHVDAAPEPSRALLGMVGLAFVGLRRRRGGRAQG